MTTQPLPETTEDDYVYAQIVKILLDSALEFRAVEGKLSNYVNLEQVYKNHDTAPDTILKAKAQGRVTIIGFPTDFSDHYDPARYIKDFDYTWTIYQDARGKPFVYNDGTPAKDINLSKILPVYPETRAIFLGQRQFNGEPVPALSVSQVLRSWHATGEEGWQLEEDLNHLGRYVENLSTALGMSGPDVLNRALLEELEKEKLGQDSLQGVLFYISRANLPPGDYINPASYAGNLPLFNRVMKLLPEDYREQHENEIAEVKADIVALSLSLRHRERGL